MRHFRILPTDQSSQSGEITALDAGSVLNIVCQLQCKEADVFEGDGYCFSVRLSDGGLWSIFKRDPAGDGEVIATFS